MTIQEMHDYFNLVQDKFNDPYFVDTEIDVFINRAQEKFVNKLIFRDILGVAIPQGVQAITGLETTLQSDEILKTLITVDKAVTTTGTTGVKILYLDIDAALMHILSVKASPTNTAGTGTITNNKTLRFIRHNDEGKFEDNTFKQGSLSKPYYKIGSDGLYLYPSTSVVENFLTSFITKPTDVDIAGTNSELPAYTHERLVAMAIEIAGIATESEAMMIMNKV
jgi:hypothetical protein